MVRQDKGEGVAVMLIVVVGGRGTSGSEEQPETR